MIGTKELVAWLPTLLGLGPDDLVVYPTMAYPDYQVGAKIAGCRAVACDDLDELGDARPALVWINSPSNPTGQILDAGDADASGGLGPRARGARRLRRVLRRVRLGGRAGLGAAPIDQRWQPRRGCWPLHSLSKRSNLAGYRAGFVAGDRDVVADLLPSASMPA